LTSPNQQFKQTDTVIQQLNNDPFVKPILQQMHEISKSKNSHEISAKDKISKYIKTIAEHLEGIYVRNGVAFLIDDICGNVVKFLEINDLEMYIYLPPIVLPPKYKNMNKDSTRFLYRKIAFNKINRSFQEMQTVEIEPLDETTIRELRQKAIEEVDRYDNVLKGMGLSPNEIGHTQLNALSENEKNKFQTAKIGEPLATPEELTKEEKYAIAFEDMKKTLSQFINAAKLFYEWFVVRYPPLEAEDCVKLKGAMDKWLELFRPFFDHKYRMDHSKALRVACRKVEDTSTRASKESRVMCAHIKDKNGNPVYRAITKEQIDASYDWEINFWRDMFTEFFGWYDTICEINAKHGEKCLADRAVLLSGTLSHFA
jgi:hypothetical protein